ncbi:MAG: mechanosensitive ion channel family protein [Bacteroidia bacterium]
MSTWFTAETRAYLIAILIFLVTVLIALIFNRMMKRFFKKSSDHLSNDPVNYQFLRRAILVLIYLIGLSLTIYAIPELRTLAQSVLAGAGIMAVAVGFASQAALSNIIAGIFIVLFKPFRVNDRITVRDTISGVVEDITLRHTIIRNFQNRRVILPNSMISEEVIINADLIESKICQWIELGISYDSNIDLAKRIITEEVSQHPNFIDNREEVEIAEGEPLVGIRLISLGDFSVNLRAYAWAQDQAKGFAMQCDLLESIKKRFDREGIEIPFPYRTVVFKNQPPQGD